VSPRFAHLCREAANPVGPAQPGGRPALAALREAAPAERRGLLGSLLRDKVARVLGTAPSRLDDELSLLNLGLDSLMAVELRNWIESELRVNLPIVELMRSPNLARLTELLLEPLAQLEGGAAEAKNGRAPPPLAARPEELLANLDGLSGEEVDALLTTLLADKERPGPTP
jgi:aryl carrier-like protein